MKPQLKMTLARGLAGAMALLGLAACSSDNNNTTPILQPPQEFRYDVTVTNLTHGQPLSPVAVLLHDEGSLWTFGEAASNELEVLAEGGDNADVLGLSFVDMGASGTGPIPPGGSETVILTLTGTVYTYLTLATMLVNTNDAFAGVSRVQVSQLGVGDSMSLRAPVYDAGTEQNSELAGTIPGPADGGEGYNATRNDVNFVARHPGVVSADDGLTLSVLSDAHRFDNPLVNVEITRVQ
ncbi:spondin domain-containing protein [Pleionea sp. CnH1-48]|uniref:spondin domain-containing protein n=1 Tax=Pleionea sp. CnH1-48 TaxID=2954494 RepID=UPI0020973EBB|nr:spondin domain-containing protein [Pleionea sp. CnH1-48]MCO7226889.1 spondin domain-containing protein [Pleionea sp. CnH1-48]